MRSYAWKRNRIFNDAVTPEFLNDISSVKCPVTNVILTKTTGTATDWLVDRVNNEGSYCPYNLVIVSSRANTLKNNYSYEDIMKFAYDEACALPKGIYGLTPLSRIEWSRWALICSLAPNSIDKITGRFIQHEVIAPCIIIPPSGLMESIAAFLQISISGMISGKGACFKEITAMMLKPQRTAMHNLVKRAKKIFSSGNYTPMQIWYNERLFKEMESLDLDFSVEMKDSIRMFIIKKCQATPVAGDLDMGLDSNGYIDNELQESFAKILVQIKALTVNNKTSINFEMQAEMASIQASNQAMIESSSL